MKYTYTIPEDARSIEAPVEKVTLKKLKGHDQEMALERGGGDPLKTGIELAKQSVVALDGKPFIPTDPDSEITWNNLDPRAREFISNAYYRLHRVSDKQVEDFLKTEVVEA
jgi:hypothetical protein